VTSYIARRLLVLPAVLLAAYTIVFLMARAAPGGPWDPDIMVPEAVRENLRRYFHADEPIWVQYWRFLHQIVAHGNFGPSATNLHRDVGSMIADALPVSLQLGAAAMTLSIGVGVLLGVLAAVRQNGLLDYLAMITALVGISLPAFVVTPLLVVLFAVQWRLLPSSGWAGLLSASALIPVFTLALGPMAGLARYTRGAVLDVVRLDFVRSAQAKGLDGRHVTLRHVLPNALIPVITVTGDYLTRVLTGAFFVESIYAIPGMGRLMVHGILNRDYPLILAATLVIAALIAVINLLVDLAYALIDPRVRYD
jgi:ABC-type dipeptide/oligopeptide/nickel transport system permease component